MKHLLDNLEIYLTFAGLAVIFLAAGLFRQYGYWQALGVTAIAVGVVHGFLFWGIRWRQRRVRQELIQALRLMLSDRINNNLTVLLAAASEGHSEGRGASAVVSSPTYRKTIETAMQAAYEISATVERLSLDSLRRWQRHYRMDVLSTE